MSAPQINGNPFTDDFESLIEEVRKQLLAAQTHFDIWEALYFRSEDVAAVLDMYKGFFVPTIDAHVTVFFIKALNVVDSDKRAPSFHRVFRMIERDSTLAPGLSLEALLHRLEKQQDTLDRLKSVRNKRAAHWDTKSEPDTVLVEESRTLLQELQSIFNDIHNAHAGSMWRFKLLDDHHTGDVVLALKEYLDILPNTTKIVWTATQDGSNRANSIVASDLIDQLRKALGCQEYFQEA